ncbi:hypothetical protein [Mesoflavibacter profundi]|uniref:Dihydroorotase n=1 Tax=Mesoflavibacter profundi TaxID=2708110 RepID=A0ABT4S1S8_9FLAO|nr:hypothetical protein [Mesoflavibacter profundi]MDA0177741.1 hypothetical protein [Mesoflavibacter profundi]
MKKLLLLLSFLTMSFVVNAQTEPKVGDVLIVKQPSNQYYNHVDFPKLNILVKRGKIASYKSEFESEVVIQDVKTKSNGDTYVVLSKKDGSKFFGLKTKVKANYNKAIEAGELKIK